MGTLDGKVAIVTGASRGIGAEIARAVNALSPSRVVPTPGTVFHRTTSDDPRAEPPSVMAEAALLLCSGDPKALTGRIAYSQQLIAELGGTLPARG
jgi:citronellol/citronellal dehydrogenase